MMSTFYTGGRLGIISLRRLTGNQSRWENLLSIVLRHRVTRRVASVIASMPGRSRCVSSATPSLPDRSDGPIPRPSIATIWPPGGSACGNYLTNVSYCQGTGRPRRCEKNSTITPSRPTVEEGAMNLDQRNEDQSIRSGEPPAVTGPPANFHDLSADDEFEETPFSKWILPVSLFVTTIFTTLWAGAYQVYNGPIHGPVNFLLEQPTMLWRGIPFAATLLVILVTHECGHYVLSRIHRVPASLPLFIPGPPYFIGTFGAIIRLRGPIMNRRALFDVGVSGPLAGFVVAVVALVVGLNLSTVVDRTATHGMQLGEPLLLQFIAWLVVGSLPPQADIILHPIAFAPRGGG